MKNIKLFLLGIFLLIASTFAFAADSDHLSQAMEHTQAAIKEGTAGNAAGIAEHGKTALLHAQAAEKTADNPHTTQGITHLRAAVDAGNSGDAKGGSAHAEEALKHFSMARESTNK